jgi:hypothetical protein
VIVCFVDIGGIVVITAIINISPYCDWSYLHNSETHRSLNGQLLD